MNWLIFALVAYAALVLEAGLGGVVAIGTVTPRLLLIVGAYIGLTAPRSLVPWALLLLGLLADLQPGPDLMPGEGYQDVILGPSALGFLFGGYIVTWLRGLVFRDSVITLAVVTFVAGLGVELTETALLAMRGWSWLTAQPVENWSTAGQLAHGFLELLYSAVVAVPIGWLLLRSTSMWGFNHKSR